MTLVVDPSIHVLASTIPPLSAAQMAEVDRLAVEEYGIDLLQMMEQAGSHLAEVVRIELGGSLDGRSVVVAAGPGNNGGGGLTAARHLANRGADVRVVLARGPAQRGQLESRLRPRRLALTVTTRSGDEARAPIVVLETTLAWPMASARPSRGDTAPCNDR